MSDEQNIPSTEEVAPQVETETVPQAEEATEESEPALSKRGRKKKTEIIESISTVVESTPQTIGGKKILTTTIREDGFYIVRDLEGTTYVLSKSEYSSLK